MAAPVEGVETPPSSKPVGRGRRRWTLLVLALLLVVVVIVAAFYLDTAECTGCSSTVPGLSFRTPAIRGHSADDRVLYENLSVFYSTGGCCNHQGAPFSTTDVGLEITGPTGAPTMPPANATCDPGQNFTACGYSATHSGWFAVLFNEQTPVQSSFPQGAMSGWSSSTCPCGTGEQLSIVSTTNLTGSLLRVYGTGSDPLAGQATL